MDINRYNYEEFFLLYLDNELSKEERNAVEAFVVSNPDLEEEFIMLKQSKLKTDHSLVLENKDFLYKAEKAQEVNLNNYEEFFVLYVDEELNPELRREVETFAASHAGKLEELGLMLQTRIHPDLNVVFADKDVLYRKEKVRAVYYFSTWRIVAVAAMILLALGIFWVINQNDSKVLPPEIAKTEVEPEKKETVKEESPKDNIILPEESKQQLAETNQSVRENRNNDKKIKSNTPVELKNEKVDPPALVINEPVESLDAVVKPSAIAKLEKTEQAPVVDYGNKVLIIDEPYPAEKQPVESYYVSNEKDDIAIGPIQTKNTLRGFFRKVSRVVGKTTNIPGDKSLLIGNIEIALK